MSHYSKWTPPTEDEFKKEYVKRIFKNYPNDDQYVIVHFLDHMHSEKYIEQHNSHFIKNGTARKIDGPNDEGLVLVRYMEYDLEAWVPTAAVFPAPFKYMNKTPFLSGPDRILPFRNIKQLKRDALQENGLLCNCGGMKRRDNEMCRACYRAQWPDAECRHEFNEKVLKPARQSEYARRRKRLGQEEKHSPFQRLSLCYDVSHEDSNELKKSKEKSLDWNRFVRTIQTVFRPDFFFEQYYNNSDDYYYIECRPPSEQLGTWKNTHLPPVAAC